MPPKRKFESGCEKRKKKKRSEALIQSQRGALEKFVIKDSQISTDNQNNDNMNLHENDDDIDCNVSLDDENVNCDVIPENSNDVPLENVNDVPNTDDVPSTGDVPIDDEPNTDDVHVENSNRDIYDPRYWDGLEEGMICVLASNGPKRDLTIEKGPNDRFYRHFSSIHYNRILSNGEKWDRDWLVYSKELDKVFCFCCKVFRKGHGVGELARGVIMIGSILAKDLKSMKLVWNTLKI